MRFQLLISHKEGTEFTLKATLKLDNREERAAKHIPHNTPLGSVHGVTHTPIKVSDLMGNTGMTCEVDTLEKISMAKTGFEDAATKFAKLLDIALLVSDKAHEYNWKNGSLKSSSEPNIF